MLFPFDDQPEPSSCWYRETRGGKAVFSNPSARVEYHELPTRNWINRCVSLRGVAVLFWTINPYRGLRIRM